jgi:hypothetical protein
VSVTSHSTNHLSTLIITKQHTRNFLGVWEPASIALGSLFFYPLHFGGGHNFFNSISFFKIFSASNAPIGEVQVFFDTKNNKTLP